MGTRKAAVRTMGWVWVILAVALGGPLGYAGWRAVEKREREAEVKAAEAREWERAQQGAAEALQRARAVMVKDEELRERERRLGEAETAAAGKR